MNYKGFTLIEIMIIVVILSIAMVVAVPMFSGAASFQLESATSMIAADLEYAKSLAITRQQQYGILFDTASDSYRLVDQDGNVITNPVTTKPYIVDFRNEGRLKNVDLAQADFDGTATIRFDYLGSPYNGNDTAMNSGTIRLQVSSGAVEIKVEPVTGYVTIQ